MGNKKLNAFNRAMKAHEASIAKRTYDWNNNSFDLYVKELNGYINFAEEDERALEQDNLTQGELDRLNHNRDHWLELAHALISDMSSTVNSSYFLYPQYQSILARINTCIVKMGYPASDFKD